ncbi:MAG: RidA family protein [Defluviitaleaceae bacterium]|nr:RidA family protein [Defluviitaleaceae bacterium]
MTAEQKLQELGITLPAAPKPVAAYVPIKQSGNTLYLSGQLPMVEGKLQYTGKVGDERTLEDGAKAAKICAINALAAIKEHIGSLNKVKNILKLQVFIASKVGFDGQPEVANGASEFFAEVFGQEIGSHARSALGTNQLPRDATVEIDLVVEIG